KRGLSETAIGLNSGLFSYLKAKQSTQYNELLGTIFPQEITRLPIAPDEYQEVLRHEDFHAFLNGFITPPLRSAFDAHHLATLKKRYTHFQDRTKEQQLFFNAAKELFSTSI